MLEIVIYRLAYHSIVFQMLCDSEECMQLLALYESILQKVDD